MEGSKKRNKKGLVIGVFALILFAAVFIGIINLYSSESAATVSQFSTEESADENRINIDIKLMSVDPVKGDLVARLQFTPVGDLIDTDGVSVSKNLVLDLNSSTGKAEYTFKKGERMNPIDMTVSLHDGIASDYPFDTHKTELMIGLSEAVSVTQAAAAGEKPVTTTEYSAVPIAINYEGALTGYKITPSEAADKEEGFSEIDLNISRSFTVLCFAIFVMVLKWGLAASALFVAISVVFKGRKPEIGMFSWLGALLFALPPLRNVMPAAPPIGTFSDFLSFFWAEGIVAICLVAVVFTWLFRPAK